MMSLHPLLKQPSAASMESKLDTSDLRANARYSADTLPRRERLSMIRKSVKRFSGATSAKRLRGDHAQKEHKRDDPIVAL
jgi:hypothetical protein